MATNLLKIHLHKIKPSNPSPQFHPNRHFTHLSIPPPIPQHRPKIPPLSLQCNVTPPTTKEEAILQAKTCLSTTLEKPLNNPKLAGKLKKVKQPRFRLEIPVVDDSPASISQLALDVFKDLPVKRKGLAARLLIIYPNTTLTETAAKAFKPRSSSFVEHMDISSVTNGDTKILTSADVTVFLAPEASQLAIMKTVTDSLYPRPVVIFNPKWGFEEESSFGELEGFLGTFEVVYSFMGLEVRGLLSKRKGMVFRCVRDGVLSGEKWSVLVEEEGQLKVISRFKERPSINEVENVLYNLMAINSPITKSAKFLKDLVSNVTGKKFPLLKTWDLDVLVTRGGWKAGKFASISLRESMEELYKDFDMYSFLYISKKLKKCTICKKIAELRARK